MHIEISPRQRVSSDSAPCSLCLKELGEPFLKIQDSPYLLGVTRHDRTEDRFVSFGVYICPHCRLVQTDAKISEDVYSEIHSHAVGKLWEQHRESLAEFIRSSTLAYQGRCLEIGPSISPILRSVRSGISETLYIDMMEDPPFCLEAHESYQKGYLATGASAAKFDLIVASHVLEHVPKMYDFMRDLTSVLSKDGAIVFSIPNFYEWIRQGFWNAMSFEHICYPFKSQIVKLAHDFGLAVRFEHFKEHSLFILLTQSEGAIENAESSEQPDAEKLIMDWATRINETVNKFEKSLCESGDVVFAGASHLSQYLYLMSPRLANTCKYVIDNAASKHGFRLYGTDLHVAPFSLVREFKNPKVFIPPSPYQEEMAKQVLKENSAAHLIM